MRLILSGCAILAMVACSPPVPDSGAGVGFDNPAMNPQSSSAPGFEPAVPPAQAVSQETLSTLQATQSLTVVATAPAGQNGVVNASPSNPQPVKVENAGISDENDFATVGTRRTIEDDAKRRADIAAQYQVVAPTDLPQRQSSGPNIVDYALKSTNPVGTRIYQRFGLNAQARFDRNCRKYPSPDQAQIDFLTKGGPAKDRLGLDPDGDGYACSWNPQPFRKALNG
ncbi:hypothetical protein NBRC116601_13040 [Cognatishimia sp. WU-CL00825]|uniref:hypothetical protein n=1 Tax=Cognatishimia sp. WU-CL00825 TaxID=3127658 RepID=UPI0031087936